MWYLSIGLRLIRYRRIKASRMGRPTQKERRVVSVGCIEIEVNECRNNINDHQYKDLHERNSQTGSP